MNFFSSYYNCRHGSDLWNAAPEQSETALRNFTVLKRIDCERLEWLGFGAVSCEPIRNPKDPVVFFSTSAIRFIPPWSFNQRPCLQKSWHAPASMSENALRELSFSRIKKAV